MLLENTVSLDQENIRIRERYRTNLRIALHKRSLKIKELEIVDQQKFACSLPIFSKDSLFWLGLGLYWAEGAKTERWRAVFYNSDPSINRAMMSFFREVCDISDDEIRIQLLLHSNIEEKGAKLYWSQILDMPVTSFYKASYVVSRASKGKRPKMRLPYGTVQISVSGKIIANKIKGWIMGANQLFLWRR